MLNKSAIVVHSAFLIGESDSFRVSLYSTGGFLGVKRVKKDVWREKGVV